jgi:hypothetical protein
VERNFGAMPSDTLGFSEQLESVGVLPKDFLRRDRNLLGGSVLDFDRLLNLELIAARLFGSVH